MVQPFPSGMRVEENNTAVTLAGERLGSHRREDFVRGSKLPACVHASAPCSGSGMRAFASRASRSRRTLSETWIVNGRTGATS